MCRICGCPQKLFEISAKSKCPECGTEVSRKAKECPICGCLDTYFIPLHEKTSPVSASGGIESEDGDSIEGPFEPDEAYYLNDPYEPDEDDAVDGSWESVCDYGYDKGNEECDVDLPEYNEDDYPDYYWEDMFD